jgi:hypothetical protein
MSPDEIVDLTLQLIAEAGFYDAQALGVFDRLQLNQRAIVAATLLRELPPMTRLEVMGRHAAIERMTNKLAAAAE